MCNSNVSHCFSFCQWVPSGSDEPKNTPVRVDNPNQFAPLGADPKELRKKHKEVSNVGGM